MTSQPNMIKNQSAPDLWLTVLFMRKSRNDNEAVEAKQVNLILTKDLSRISLPKSIPRIYQRKCIRPIFSMLNRVNIPEWFRHSAT